MFQHVIIWYVFFLRASLAALFVVSGSAKLADTRGFAATLRGLGLPPHPVWLTQSLSLALPLLEIGVGLLTVSGLWPGIMDGSLFILLCIFTLVVLYALQKKRTVTCRCFGTLSDSQFSGKGLAQNFLFILAAFLVIIGSMRMTVVISASGATVPLVISYLLLVGVVVQAAQTIAAVKGRESL